MSFFLRSQENKIMNFSQTHFSKGHYERRYFWGKQASSSRYLSIYIFKHQVLVKTFLRLKTEFFFLQFSFFRKELNQRFSTCAMRIIQETLISFLEWTICSFKFSFLLKSGFFSLEGFSFIFLKKGKDEIELDLKRFLKRFFFFSEFLCHQKPSLSKREEIWKVLFRFLWGIDQKFSQNFNRKREIHPSWSQKKKTFFGQKKNYKNYILNWIQSILILTEEKKFLHFFPQAQNGINFKAILNRFFFFQRKNNSCFRKAKWKGKKYLRKMKGQDFWKKLSQLSENRQTPENVDLEKDKFCTISKKLFQKKIHQTLVAHSKKLLLLLLFESSDCAAHTTYMIWTPNIILNK